MAVAQLSEGFDYLLHLGYFGFDCLPILRTHRHVKNIRLPSFARTATNILGLLFANVQDGFVDHVAQFVNG